MTITCDARRWVSFVSRLARSSRRSRRRRRRSFHRSGHRENPKSARWARDRPVLSRATSSATSRDARSVVRGERVIFIHLARVLARSSTHLIHDARLRERRTGRRAREVVAWTRWSGCALRLTRRRSARALVTTAERTNERTNERRVVARVEVRIDVGRRRDQRWGALTRRWRSRRNSP